MNIGVEEYISRFPARVEPPGFGRGRVGIDDPLPAMQRALLGYFRGHPGRVVSREELAEQVWRQRYFYGSRAIDQTVANLRKKLRPEEGRIQSIYAEGYRFERNEARARRAETFARRVPSV